MKLAPFTLSFLLFAFISKLPFAFSEDVEPVLDINGKPLSPDGQYYIIPTLRGPGGGGLRLRKTGNSECPITVLQDYLFHRDDGIPVRFSMSGGTSIFTGTPLDIEFTWKPNCAESSKWNVFFDTDIQRAYVGIGVPEDHPGRQTLSGTFRIQKTLRGYKFEFRVSGSRTCFDIDRYDNGEGGNRLILTEDGRYDVAFGDASHSGIRSVV